MDSATEASAARLKLNWWHEEMQRLIAGRPLHPISAYLAALPRAASDRLRAAAHRGRRRRGTARVACLWNAVAELEPHADALYGAIHWRWRRGSPARFPIRAALRAVPGRSPRLKCWPGRSATTGVRRTPGAYLSRSMNSWRREWRTTISPPGAAARASEDLRAIAGPGRGLLRHGCEGIAAAARAPGNGTCWSWRRSAAGN